MSLGEGTEAAAGPIRIGEFMLLKGHIGPEQLDAALRRQHELQLAGTPRLLGELLVEMGAIQARIVDEALAYQRHGKRPEG